MGESKDLLKKFAEEVNKVDAAKAAMKGFAGKVIGFEVEEEDPKTMGIKVADDGGATYVEGDIGATLLTFVADGDYLVKMLKGKVDTTKGFMAKEYSIKGNMMQATRMKSVLEKVKL